jgi:hypothetical protein
MSVHVVRNGVKEIFETLVSGRVGEIASKDLEGVRIVKKRNGWITLWPGISSRIVGTTTAASWGAGAESAMAGTRARTRR